MLNIRMKVWGKPCEPLNQNQRKDNIRNLINEINVNRDDPEKPYLEPRVGKIQVCENAFLMIIGDFIFTSRKF